jgi:hypothetical protein
MKKIVRSSNLALRFYQNDGWTKEVLEKYLIKGSFLDSKERFGDTNPYFVLNVGSQLDMKRLYEEQVSSVQRAFDDYPHQTDLGFMERFNW